MRVLTIVTLMTSAALAQEIAPIGILRGDLVGWSGTPHSGLLTVRTADNRLLECGFDDQTWFEHENEHIAIGGMRPGDHMELVADREPHSIACYARTVQTVEALQPRRTAAGKPRLRLPNSATDLFAPRGDMTLAGIVAVVDGNRLTIRTRDRGEQVLHLRPDTRYLGDGLPAERSNLEPQTLIFIRAGHNPDGGIEAYTIVWGDILQVRN